MGDSNLHIVQREDGQFEVVKLAPVNKKISHSKIETFVNSEGGSGSRKGTCTKVEKIIIEKLLIIRKYSNKNIFLTGITITNSK